jgi:chromosome segregation ATPase
VTKLCYFAPQADTISDLQLDLENSEQLLAEAKKEAAAAAAASKAAEDRVLELTRKLEQERKEFEGLRSKKEEVINELRADLDSVKAEKKQLEIDIKSMTEEEVTLREWLRVASETSENAKDELEVEKMRLEEALTREADTVADLQANIDELEGEVETLKGSLARVENELKVALGKGGKDNVEADELKRKLAAAEKDLASAKEEIVRLYKQVSILEMKLEPTSQGQMEVKSGVTGGFESKPTEKVTDGRSAQVDDNENVQHLNSSMSQEDDLRANVHAMKQQIEALENKIAEMTGEADALKMSLEDAKSANQGLETALSAKSRECVNLEQKLQVVNLKIEEMSAAGAVDTEKFKAEVESLRQKLEAALEREAETATEMQEEITQLEAKDSALKAEIEEARKQISHLRKELESERRKLEETLTREAETVSELQATIDELEKKVTETQGAMEKQARKDANKLELALTRESDTVSELETSIERYEERVQTLEKELTELKEALRQANLSSDTSERTSEPLRTSQAEILQEAVKGKRDLVPDQQGAGLVSSGEPAAEPQTATAREKLLCEPEPKAHTINAQTAASTKDSAKPTGMLTFQSRLNEIASEKEELEQKLLALESIVDKKLSELQANIKQLSVAGDQEADKKIFTLESRLNAATAEKQALQDQLSNESKALREAQKALKSERAKLEQAMTREAETVSELQTSLDQLEAEKQDLQNTLSTFQIKFDEMNTERQDLERNLSGLHSSVDEGLSDLEVNVEQANIGAQEAVAALHGELAAANAQNQALQDQLSNESKALREAQKALKSERAKLEQAMTREAETVSDLQTSLDQLEAEKQDLQNTLLTLRVQIDETQTAKQALEKELADEKQALHDAQKALKTERKKLEQALTRESDTVSSLQNTIDEFEKRVVSLESELKEADARVAQQSAGLLTTQTENVTPAEGLVVDLELMLVGKDAGAESKQMVTPSAPEAAMREAQETSDVRKQIDDLAAYNEILQKDLDTVRKELSKSQEALHRESRKMEQALTREADVVSQLQVAIEELEGQLTTQQQACSQLQADLISALAVSEAAQAHVDLLTKKIAQTEENLNSSQTECSRLNTKINELEEQIREISVLDQNTTGGSFQGGASQQRHEQVKMPSDNKMLHEFLQGSQVESHAGGQQTSAQIPEAYTTPAHNQPAGDTGSKDREIIKTLEEQLIEAKAQEKSARNKLKSAEKRLEEELSREAETVSELQKAIEELEQANEDLRTELAASHNAANRTHKLLESERRKMEDTLTREADTVAALQTTIEDLEAQIQTLQEESERQRRTFEEKLLVNLDSTKNEIAPSPLSSLENAASAQNRQGSKQQKQYEMRVMELETALEDMQRKLDDKAQHNVELDKELAEVRFRAFDHVNLLGLLQARFECAFTRERIDLYCIIT